MNAFLGLGWLGWIASAAVGFAVGGLFFLCTRAQVEYVAEHRGPEWLLPAMLYARVLLLALVMGAVGLAVPRDQVAGAVVGGLVGAAAARVLVMRSVRRGRRKGAEPRE